MNWTHLSDTKPKARKSHKCFLCDQTIEAGEKYVCRRGITSDGLLVMKMHAACEELTHDWDQMDWECFDPTEFPSPQPERSPQ